jgi:signal transduction histidine kinase
MSFRTRLLAGFFLVVLAPFILLAVMIPREMTKRLATQYRAAVSETGERVRSALDQESERIASRLGAVAAGLRDEPLVRRALVSSAADRGDLLDYSEAALLRTGLDMLQIQNDSGRILSSGHFRNEFDRVDHVLPGALSAASDNLAMVRVRTPRGAMLALVRSDTTEVGGRVLSVTGGVAVAGDYMRNLASGGSPALSVTLSVPDGIGSVPTEAGASSTATAQSAAGASAVARSGISDSVGVPFIDATGDSAWVGTAGFVVTHSTAELVALVSEVRAWILGALLLATAAAFAAALWLSSRLSHPLEELAAESARVDLEQPRADFAGAGRDDEIGTLARRLGTMVDRLRGSAAMLRDAERRATLGEMARQVTHDIKNGLTPIRNVVRHLAQVAREQPSELASLYVGRQQTLESSIEYLDALARNYARLSTRPSAPLPCDVRAVIDEVFNTARVRAGETSLRSQYAAGLQNVLADRMTLRRILENLVGNALDAVGGKAGDVVVSAAPFGAHGARMVRITVADSGSGMTEEELRRAFDDFYTTRPGGTGLGLSVVRRLVADMSGTLRIETEPGRGTQVIVDLQSVDNSAPRSSAERTESGAGAV